MIERMSGDEYRNLEIDYGYYTTPVGDVLIASSARGICCIEFADNRDNALQLLCRRFTKSIQRMRHTAFHDKALRYFYSENDFQDEIRLHLYGTDFQIEVWKALLDIPLGGVSTYGDIALAIGNPGATRAVGTAIGRNPVAVIVPCHRVSRSDGGIGGYYWGTDKKKMILDLESKKYIDE